MKRLARLFVLWRDQHQSRRVIGQLWRTPEGGFSFAYADSLPAASDGFMLLAEFPEVRRVDAPYCSRYLFPTFAQRIPGPSRTDRARLLRDWGVVNEDDVFEILARSGGVQLTDRIELAEYRALDDDLHEPVEFRIAGASQAQFAAGAKLVRPGDRLLLKREPENGHDQFATIVLESAGTALGYVPRQYSQMVARLLDTDIPLVATAQRMVVTPDAGRWVVRIARS